jgi:hypothetical protein
MLATSWTKISLCAREWVCVIHWIIRLLTLVGKILNVTTSSSSNVILIYFSEEATVRLSVATNIISLHMQQGLESFTAK